MKTEKEEEKNPFMENILFTEHKNKNLQPLLHVFNGELMLQKMLVFSHSLQNF